MARSSPTSSSPAVPLAPERVRRTARIKMLIIVALCAAPTIAAYVAYYLVKPSGRTKAGTLLEPQRPVGALGGELADGARFRLSDLHGRWILLAVQPGACEDACRRRLWVMRQVRLTTGRERDRVERVVLTGATPLPPAVIAEHPGLVVARSDVGPALPVDDGTRAADHLWIVDPLGNLMMRFPADVDPNRMKKDLAKLLKNSRIG